MSVSACARANMRRQSDAAHETATGEVRSELRLKSFELSQLGVAHAEKCSCLRQVRHIGIHEYTAIWIDIDML